VSFQAVQSGPPSRSARIDVLVEPAVGLYRIDEGGSCRGRNAVPQQCEEDIPAQRGRRRHRCRGVAVALDIALEDPSLGAFVSWSAAGRTRSPHRTACPAGRAAPEASEVVQHEVGP